MNCYSQLARLVFSFYRENPTQLQQLRPLQHCKLTRRWGVLRVNCSESQTTNAVLQAIELLREPVAALRLARQINVLHSGSLIKALPVFSSKIKIVKYTLNG